MLEDYLRHIPLIGNHFAEKLWKKLKEDVIHNSEDGYYSNLNLEKIKSENGIEMAIYCANKLKIHGRNQKLKAIRSIINTNQDKEIIDLVCDERFVELFKPDAIPNILDDQVIFWFLESTKDISLIERILKSAKAGKDRLWTILSYSIRERRTIEKVLNVFDKSGSKELEDLISNIAGTIKNDEILSKVIDFALVNNDKKIYDFIKEIRKDREFLSKTIDVVQKYDKLLYPVIDCLVHLSKDNIAQRMNIANFFEKYSYKMSNPIISSIRSMSISNNVGYIQASLEFYEKIFDRGDVDDAADLFMKISHKEHHAMGTVISILEKYPDKFIKDVVLYCLQTSNEKNIGELLWDENYEILKQSKNPEATANKMFKKRYSSTIHKINIVNLSYANLDAVIDTYDFVMQIHRNRTTDDRVRIEQGFYEELNRAIAQKDNYKEKARMLRQYCKEVREQIADNVFELMVMHNA